MSEDMNSIEKLIDKNTDKLEPIWITLDGLVVNFPSRQIGDVLHRLNVEPFNVAETTIMAMTDRLQLKQLKELIEIRLDES